MGDSMSPRLSRAGGSRKVPVRYAADAQVSPTLRAALRAHKKAQFDEARGLYVQQLTEQPECLDALMNLGALYALAGCAPEAREAFEAASRLAPDDARVHRDVGLGWLTIGQLARAAEALERSVQVDPELVGSWLHLARVRLERTSREHAVAAAQRALSLRPHDASGWVLLARCVFDDEARGPALEALCRAAQCAGGASEAELFHWLLSDGRLPGAASACGAAALTARHPQAAALADAMDYVRQSMPGARLFSSARETLHFAVDQAPRTGPVLELGVFHGVSLRWLVARCPGRWVHGFDTFWGLPSSWDPVPAGRFTTAGRTPSDIDAQFWVGTFEEQLPRYVAAHTEPIALLHVDSDLYESARCGLRCLAPRLVPGSVVVFDEYLGHKSWRHDEHRALQEAVREQGLRYRYLAANPFTGQAVVSLVS